MTTSLPCSLASWPRRLAFDVLLAVALLSTVTQHATQADSTSHASHLSSTSSLATVTVTATAHTGTLRSTPIRAHLRHHTQQSLPSSTMALPLRPAPSAPLQPRLSSTGFRFASAPDIIKPSAKAIKVLKDIKPMWWRPAEEASETEPTTPTNLRNDPFIDFNPKRPKDGYTWNQALWHPGVSGRCEHCRYSPVISNSTPDSKEELNGALPDNAPNSNAGSPPVPFVLPHQWVQKVPKGLLNFRQLFPSLIPSPRASATNTLAE